MARSIALRCPLSGRPVRWLFSSDKVSLALGQGGECKAWRVCCPACGQEHLVNVETLGLPDGAREPATTGFVHGARQ